MFTTVTVGIKGILVFIIIFLRKIIFVLSFYVEKKLRCKVSFKSFQVQMMSCYVIFWLFKLSFSYL